jgi:hypothetical protein
VSRFRIQYWYNSTNTSIQRDVIQYNTGNVMQRNTPGMKVTVMPSYCSASPPFKKCLSSGCLFKVHPPQLSMCPVIVCIAGAVLSSLAVVACACACSADPSVRSSRSKINGNSTMLLLVEQRYMLVGIVLCCFGLRQCRRQRPFYVRFVVLLLSDKLFFCSLLKCLYVCTLYVLGCS